MSPTERCPLSHKYIKLAKINFETDEDSELNLDENELTDSESETDTDYENFNSYEEEEGSENEERLEEEKNEELDVTPISRFSSMDYSTKLNNIRRRLFIADVRRRLFSYNVEEEEQEDSEN